uniref:GGDEF domain-containing protein n=1 Tax=Ningiella ruwaisensis TaxID=2364274 RepID=UPI00109FC330|nr:GGDEF domain-containing protein [Ningiella ruwaisensis]
MKAPVNSRNHLEDSYKELESRHGLTRFETSMRTICFVGAIAHIAFLFLFALMDVVAMVIFNIVSVAVWIFAFFLSQRRQFEKSVNIIAAEMYCHAIVATLFVGPDLGFQYYLWPILGLLLSLPNNKLKQSTFLCLLVVISFILLTLFTKNVSYSYELIFIVEWIYAMNVLFAALPFIFTILYLRNDNLVNEKELFSQANMDPLSGTYNRRFVNDLMSTSDTEQRRRSFDTYTIVLGDVDHFKQINDTHGHQVGDEVIRRVAEVLQDNVRDSDIVSRWGGEEFLVILANADTETAEKVVNKIRHGIKAEIQIPVLKETGVTMSFGIANAHRHMSFEETVRQADIKLYQAKATGRDKMLS